MKRHFKILVDGVIFTHPKEHPSIKERLAMYKDMKSRKEIILMLWR